MDDLNTIIGDCIDGEAGPYEFNWYWQPFTGATIPTGTVIPSEEARPVTHVLFNRGAVTFSDEVLRCEYNRDLPTVLRERLESRTEQERKRDDLVGTISQFWSMLLISARWIAGAPEEAEPRHLAHIQKLMNETQEALGVEPTFPAGRTYSGAASKVSILREAASTVEQLMPIAASMIGAVVNPAIVGRTSRFLDMIATS